MADKVSLCLKCGKVWFPAHWDGWTDLCGSCRMEQNRWFRSLQSNDPTLSGGEASVSEKDLLIQYIWPMMD